ncbi:MAG: hypothetical protein K2L42_05370 [Clostridia bacterium]|nr:hypothetical protein [Clostridia bacterium]
MVKKVARLAVCNVVGDTITAQFSIETDKGVYCFRVAESKMSMVPSDLFFSIYPVLAP